MPRTWAVSKNCSHLDLSKKSRLAFGKSAPDIETKLKSLGQRGDIIKTMHRIMRGTGIDRPAGSFAMFDAHQAEQPNCGPCGGTWPYR